MVNGLSPGTTRGTGAPTTMYNLETRKLLRTRILGGLINERRHAA